MFGFFREKFKEKGAKKVFVVVYDDIINNVNYIAKISGVFDLNGKSFKGKGSDGVGHELFLVVIE